ncbi:MAG: hypothetical protein VKJ02_17430 [Snowella sp.]|nr:hypothetical protein [Snowella sp.]
MIDKQSLQPVDKVAMSLIAGLTVVMGSLIISEKVCNQNCWFENRPRIKSFSWQDQVIGSEDKAFILTFDRPMDHQEIEKKLTIIPPLPGKFSWAGRRLAYTLETPIPYGEKYQVQLSGVKEQFLAHNKEGKEMRPFVGEFRSRDRAFAYIGTQAEEAGRLIFYNLTQQEKTLLTPKHLTVVDFKFYPNGDRVLFSAADKSLGFDGLRQLQLYSIPIEGTNNPEIVLAPQLILDNKEYQNNQFDISADGKIIVVQRVNRENPADFDLWMIKDGEEPTRLKVTGGDFRIAPDSQSLAVARGEGIGILPLQPDSKPLDFLPKFGQLLSFSPDGSAAAVVNFNTDNAKMRFKRSLFYVNNQGIQKELLNTEGSIINCQFNTTNTELYCLLTDLVKGKEYQEQPYFTKINLKTGQVVPLAALPEYRDTKVSLSPDGLALLFDQVLASNASNFNTSLSTSAGESVLGGKLWLLIPPLENTGDKQPELKELPLAGFRPQWLP